MIFNAVCFLIATTISLVSWKIGSEFKGDASFFYLIAISTGACAIGYAKEIINEAGI